MVMQSFFFFFTGKMLSDYRMFGKHWVIIFFLHTVTIHEYATLW